MKSMNSNARMVRFASICVLEAKFEGMGFFFICLIFPFQCFKKMGVQNLSHKNIFQRVF